MVRLPNYSGVVYIDMEWGVVPRSLPIEGHWELPGLDRVAEDGPGWLTAAEAIAWGRKRAPLVWLRVHRSTYSYRYVQVGSVLVRLHAPLEDDYVIYSAGEGLSHAGLSDEEYVRRWPGAATSRDEDLLPEYGGEVFLVQWSSEHDGAGEGGVIARWEALSDGVQHVAEVAGPRWDGGIVDAIEWARQRAPYVLVCSGPWDFGYLSAGDEDPAGLGLARWPGHDERLRENRPPHEGTIWVEVYDSEAKGFPLPDDVEPAGGLPGQQDGGEAA